jgi:hypothetical protein
VSGIYPLTPQELKAAEDALMEMTEGSSSVTACVHAVLRAVDRLRAELPGRC